MPQRRRGTRGGRDGGAHAPRRRHRRSACRADRAGAVWQPVRAAGRPPAASQLGKQRVAARLDRIRSGRDLDRQGVRWGRRARAGTGLAQHRRRRAGWRPVERRAVVCRLQLPRRRAWTARAARRGARPAPSPWRGRPASDRPTLASPHACRPAGRALPRRYDRVRRPQPHSRRRGAADRPQRRLARRAGRPALC